MKRKTLKEVLDLALPIIGGMVSQNILNLVDTAMVGSLGDAALAAVGMAGFVNFMCVAMVMGLSAGVQAMASRRLGEGKSDSTAAPLNGGLLLSFIVAVPLSLLLAFLTPNLFPLLVNDDLVVAEGTPYLQVRLLAMTALGMNYSFRGYWNGINLSKIYLRTLVIMHLSNLLLNYLLIFGKFGFPELQTLGAGIGTAIANYIGTSVYFFLAFRLARENGFLRAMPNKETLKTIIRISLPVSIQQLFFATGMTVFFWIVGQIGTRELAANNVLVNLLLVCILPGIGFGMACATLVGQALGRKDVKAAKDWGWIVCRIAALSIGALGLPAAIFPEFFLQFFIYDPQTLKIAILPLRIVTSMIALDSIGLVLFNAMNGAGYTRTPMILSIIMQWCLYLPIAYFMCIVLGYGLVAIWAGQMCYRGIQALLLMKIWSKGKWASVRL
ncbi:MAG: MATE family efflux transporter [Myxococcota bacterium]|nr:MATE family efflux transporter [Myxococcota bacterium]